MSPAQVQRTARDWSQAAGEPVRVELVRASLYGFCSELGALRLFHKYRFAKREKVRADKSPSEGWFFRLELNPEVVRFLQEEAAGT